MALTLTEYDLPDAFLFNESSEGFIVWQPERSLIVLGQSNTIESSVFSENAINDNIPVTRRPSGGEAVLLTPLTIAFTVSKSFSASVHFRDFFRTVNKMVIECLGEKGIADLGFKGISDITIGNKKILGSSMRNTHGSLIYQAVLNVSEDPALFEKYLRHPRREPDYRSGRSHSEFVTSLKAEGYNFAPGEVTGAIERKLQEYLNEQ
jgi:lipoate-protein ligase A